MKLQTVAAVSGEPMHLIDHDIVLDLSAGGRAALTLLGDVKRNQLVTVDMGYNDDLRRWFVGYVEQVVPAENGATKALCRELSGLLGKAYPVSMQHPTLRSLMDWLAKKSMLTIVLPNGTDYTDTPIPNFTSAGTGYQLLNNALRAFSVPDPCWYQQPDGAIYVGSHQHSHWHGKEATLDQSWSSKQAGNAITMAPVPAVRPGAVINGQRVNRVRITGDQMSIHSVTPGKETKSPERSKVEKEFPELADKMHIPKLGRVEAISDRASAGQLADPFRPRYAVDVQLLGEDGQPDKATPVYRAVPLPVLFGGAEQGHLQYPQPGTIVEVAFAFGRADRPFIRAILGTDMALPDIAPGEQLQQQRAEVQCRTDSAGNQFRTTDRDQTDTAHRMKRQADEYQGEFGSHRLSIDQHSIEEVGGKKAIEALGAIELLAGDDLMLASLGNMSQTTAGDLTEVVGQLRRSVAKELQHFEADKSWMGTESTNIFELLHQLMTVVEQLAATAASHTHGGPAPTQAPAFNSQSSKAGQLASTLAPIIE